MQWNPTDDYAYVNGRKTNVKCGLNSILVYHNGTFGVDVENGIYRVDSSFTSYAPQAFVNNGTILKTSSDMYPVYKQTTLVATDAIDFTNYNTVKVVTNQGTFTTDVSNVNQIAYLCLGVFNNGSRQADIYISAQKQDFGHNGVYLANGYLVLTATDVSTTFSISEIVVE